MASRLSYHSEDNQRRRLQGANRKSQALSLSSAVLAGNLRAHLSNQLRLGSLAVGRGVVRWPDLTDKSLREEA
jgi:hypothetical protein